MNKHIIIQISGKVQGVWFRDYVRKVAAKFKLVGFAKNNSDGTVTVDVCGSEKNFEEFIKLCKKGPELSNVENIEYTISKELCNYKDFKIL